MNRNAEIDGFEENDGWYVAKKRGVLVSMLRQTSPPRRYGVLDQIAIEISAPASVVVYSLCFAAIAYGVIAFDWLTIVLGTGALAFFGRSFVSGIHTGRHGVLSRVEIRHVQHDVGRGQGVNEKMRVDDKDMNVGFDLPVVRALLTQHGAVEAEVIYDPRDEDPVAHALAYRVPQSLSASGESAPVA